MADILEDEGISVEDVTGDPSSNDSNEELEATIDCPNIVVEECAVSETSDESSASPHQIAIAELKRLCESSAIYDRQIAGTKISSALIQIADNEPDIYTIFSLICKLSDDEEGLVRAELVESIPTLASYCQLYRPNMKFLMRQQLVPITVKLLSDEQKQVRDASQTVLKVLFQNDLIDEVLAKEWICPFVASNARSSASEEHLTEAATLMCNLAPLVDSSLARECFLDTFVSLADEKSISVRTICAEKFGDFCMAVGKDATESVLLPLFLKFCADEHWNVRKVCAETLADVAVILSPCLRWESLSKMFIRLLGDEVRCVKSSAYRNLGKFICSFDRSSSQDDESTTGDECANADDPDLSSFVQQKFVMKDPIDTVSTSPENSITSQISSSDLRDSYSKDDTASSTSTTSSERHSSSELSYDLLRACGDVDKVSTFENDIETTYNNFQYWRTPVLEIDFDECELSNVQEEKNCQSTFSEFSPDVQKESSISFWSKRTQSAKRRFVIRKSRRKAVSSVLEFQFQNVYEFESYPSKCKSSFDQAIVPAELLEMYVMTANPEIDFDPEIPNCSAFTFLAVAQTLGRENWGCLRKAFQMLSIDRQDDVRRTIAASLHGLAFILGRDIASDELVPHCLSFFNDTDKVRMAVLKNLSDFVGNVTKPAVKKLMEKISDFVNGDNDRNWRLREMLARQLFSILQDEKSHEDNMIPVAMFLLQDRVWDVRQSAIILTSSLLSFMYENSEKVEPILKNLFEDFAESQTWRHRQTYALLCVVSSKCFSVYRAKARSWYSQHLISHLLPLAQDPVPNVRICVARCLFGLPPIYLKVIADEHGENLTQALVSLRDDSDRDVRNLPNSRLIELHTFFGEET